MKTVKWVLGLALLTVFAVPSQVFSFDEDYCLALVNEESSGSRYIDLNIKPVKEFSGLGKLYLPKKGCFYGSFSRGYPNGYGVVFWPDGSIYRGDFRNSSAHGDGQFIHRFGWKFEGEWKADWPKSGVCTYKNKSIKCSVKESTEFAKTWNSSQRIKVSVLYWRYFYELNLLRETAHLQSGFVFRGKELDLLKGLPARKSKAYYSGSVFRNRADIGNSIERHASYLAMHIKNLAAKANTASVDNFIINISPNGEAEVFECDNESIREICEEIASIDYGIIESKHNLFLTFLFDGRDLTVVKSQRMIRKKE